ncbi:P-type conjugative transfer protein TrbJ [Aminobacter aminovorans]|uniref:Conjugal transfer protein TrbJ n=2 Tax=Aminobacter aminovorans TaxID=83263 RepID=A0AAC8YWL7_AMIAI|nr:conjugal transfer protein TrbJ [Aminobacter aminovorans]MBB3708641.1 P-type conjugative transfer protein TrbJ [Aminobacter aminovorans]
MRKRSFMSASIATSLAISLIGVTPGRAGGVTGQATEWTQLLNNGELVALVGKSTEQINNQMTQIAQLAEQIQNQIRMYENMLQNTAQLPFHVWSQVENDLNRLRSLVAQGEGIAFSMSNADDVLRQRFQSYGEFKTGLADGQTFSSSYEKWSTTNRDTIAGTLKAAGLTAEQFSSEEATMSSLRSMSESADGQMKALQVGHQIASEQVGQFQKLRGLIAQQTTMIATWFQSDQADKDLAQLRRERFFNAAHPGVRGGQAMEPRW